MPIHFPLSIESLSTEEFGPFDYSVMGHMFASQNEIGRLADERDTERMLPGDLM
jgi:hypothetical protein